MPFGLFSNNDTFLKVKTLAVDAVGLAGLGTAAYAHNIAFHEEPWFKAILAVSGLALLLLTIYSKYLDVKIKKRQIEEDEGEE